MQLVMYERRIVEVVNDNKKVISAQCFWKACMRQDLPLLATSSQRVELFRGNEVGLSMTDAGKKQRSNRTTSHQTSNQPPPPFHVQAIKTCCATLLEQCVCSSSVPRNYLSFVFRELRSIPSLVPRYHGRLNQAFDSSREDLVSSSIATWISTFRA